MAAKNTVEIILSAKDKASKAVASAMGGVQRSASMAMGAIAAGAAAAGTALVTLAGITGKVGVSYNALLEDSLIAWEGLLKSQQKAIETQEMLQQLGAKTPFEFEGLDKVARQLELAGMGGDQLKERLVALGDAVSYAGKGQEELEGVGWALSQIATKGKVQAEEMMQLGERGIDGWGLLAEGMGITKQEVMNLSQQGKLLADDVLPLMFEQMEKNFGGAMQKKSQTFNGLMSTLKDNLKMISGELTKPLFDKLKSSLEVALPVLEKFQSGLKADGLKGAFKEILPEDTYNFLVTAFNTINGAFEQVKSVFVSNKDQIIEVFNGIKENVSGFVSGYIETVKTLFSGEGNVGESFLRIFNTIKEIALPIFNDAVGFIKSTLAELKAFWDENGAQIIAAVQNMWSVIASIFNAIAPVLLFIIQMIWGNIKGVISGALDIIMGLIKIFAGLFTGDFSKMWEGIKQLFLGAIEFVWNLMNLLFVGRILGGVKTFVSNVGSSIKGMWTSTTGFFNGMLDDAARIFGKIGDKIMSPIKTAKEKVLGFVDDIKAALSNFSTKIKLPHFSVSNFSLNPKDWIKNGLPKLSVDWYDKGGVFYGPQIIGVGEKRPEFVGALDDLRKIVREETQSRQVMMPSGNVEIPLYIDGYEFTRLIISYIDLLQGNNFNAELRLSGVK